VGKKTGQEKSLLTKMWVFYSSVESSGVVECCAFFGAYQSLLNKTIQSMDPGIATKNQDQENIATLKKMQVKRNIWAHHTYDSWILTSEMK
jgi:hypothetical protein